MNDDGGWDADDDEDETEDAVARDASQGQTGGKREKQADLQRLKQATGQLHSAHGRH
jgi:hypothetical protein